MKKKDQFFKYARPPPHTVSPPYSLAPFSSMILCDTLVITTTINLSTYLFCCRLPKNTGLRPVGSAKRDLIQLQYNYNINDPWCVLLHRMFLFSFLIRDAICFCNIEQPIHLFLPWVSINSCNYNTDRSIHLFCCRLPKNTGLRPVRSAKRDFSEDWFRKR